MRRFCLAASASAKCFAISCSACLRDVISGAMPTSHGADPPASPAGEPLHQIQRDTPSGRTIRNSSSNFPVMPASSNFVRNRARS
jgi:hypothetical protein